MSLLGLGSIGLIKLLQEFQGVFLCVEHAGRLIEVSPVFRSGKLLSEILSVFRGRHIFNPFVSIGAFDKLLNAFFSIRHFSKSVDAIIPAG